MEAFETNGSAAEGWRVRADYDVRYLAPTTMEPRTCLAHIIGDRAQIWAPGQDGEGTLRTDAKVLHFSHASSDAKLDFVSNESNF